jgi:hypothetical protein
MTDLRPSDVGAAACCALVPDSNDPVHVIRHHDELIEFYAGVPPPKMQPGRLYDFSGFVQDHLAVRDTAEQRLFARRADREKIRA